MYLCIQESLSACLQVFSLTLQSDRGLHTDPNPNPNAALKKWTPGSYVFCGLKNRRGAILLNRTLLARSTASSIVLHACRRPLYIIYFGRYIYIP